MADRPLRRVGIVGLGAMGTTHARVLESIPTVRVEAAADVARGAAVTFRGVDLPVYGTVEELLARHPLDDVIVATPTPSHADVCTRLLGAGGWSRLFVEKPLATELGQVESLLEAAGRGGRALRVLYHFRTAPEVEWVAGRLDAWTARHGPVVSFACSFADPYRWLAPEQQAVFASSWVDSGINVLSILDRLVSLQERVSVREVAGAFNTYHGTVAFASGGARHLGRIVTTWQAGASSKSTFLTLEDGTGIVIDHSGNTAWIASADGTSASFFGPDTQTDRKTLRYRAMLTRTFGDGPPATDDGLDLRLHRLLLGD